MKFYACTYKNASSSVRLRHPDPALCPGFAPRPRW